MANCIVVSINKKERYTYKHFYEFYDIFEVDLGHGLNLSITKDNIDKLELLIEKANEQLEYYKGLYCSRYWLEIEIYKYVKRTLKVIISNFNKGKDISIFVE